MTARVAGPAEYEDSVWCQCCSNKVDALSVQNVAKLGGDETCDWLPTVGRFG